MTSHDRHHAHASSSSIPSPPHFPPDQPTPPRSLSFMLGPSKAQSQRQGNPYPSSQSNDMKYMAKYKEMKQKVKEIELDNDRLHLKCLKTRKNIQRLRLERAILYERISSIPAAESALFPGEPGPLPDAHPHPQPHPGHAYGHRIFSPEMQARIQADKERLQLEAAHNGHPHYLRVQIPGQMEVLHSDPPLPRHYPQRPGDASPISYSQTDPPMHVDSQPGPSTKPLHRKPPSDAQSAKNQASPPQPGPYQEVRNGGSRTYPFVLEYPHPPFVETDLGQPSYPSEIRFHQYDASDRPVHRNRRDFDREGEKGSKVRRRPPEPETEYPPHASDSQSRSPRTNSASSSHGGYAYPIQNPFLSAERESQPQPQPRRSPEGDRGPQRRPSHEPGIQPDEWRPYEGEPNVPRSGRGHAYHQQHNYESGPRQDRAQGAVRPLPPSKKRTHSHSDSEHVEGGYERYAGERNRRDDRHTVQRGRARPMEKTEGRFTLPRVRDGEVMD